MSYPKHLNVPVDKIQKKSSTACISNGNVAPNQEQTFYYFEFPEELVGRLIGRSGKTINEIKQDTNTVVVVKRHPDKDKLKLVSIEGTLSNIAKALSSIRQRFPPDLYPGLTLKSTPYVESPAKYENILMRLEKELDNEVVISSMVTASNFFLLQPNHLNYKMLVKLKNKMAEHYNNTESSPPLVDMTLNSVCVAPGPDGWYRAMIVYIIDTNFCLVKYLDFGGTKYFHRCDLRQINRDFLDLQFQAVECYLANVLPVKDHMWTVDAFQFVKELTHRKILRANICGYSEGGVPLVDLYTNYGEEVLPINKLLVDHGHGISTLPRRPAEDIESHQ